MASTASTLLFSVATTLLLLGLATTDATTITVHNTCGYTVCAKYWVPSNGVGGGCSELASGQTWTVGASPSWVSGTMWAIANTGCSGQACNTGPPSGVSQFEITVDGSSNLDYYDISVLAGFNIPLKVVPSNSGCVTVDCTANSASACPNGYYTGYTVDKTQTCGYGTNYDLYLCQ